MTRPRTVGVISDTHGLVRPQALAELADSDLIVHCGDIGASSVLEALRTIAPVRAIRGNNDRGGWAAEIPTDEVIAVGAHLLYVIHDLGDLTLEPAAAGFTVVLSGHSHRPLVERRDGVVYLNPGSAGPRRFSLPVAVARLVLRAGACEAQIVQLEV